MGALNKSVGLHFVNNSDFLFVDFNVFDQQSKKVAFRLEVDVVKSLGDSSGERFEFTDDQAKIVVTDNVALMLDQGFFFARQSLFSATNARFEFRLVEPAVFVSID